MTDVKLLKRHSEIWERVSSSIKNRFDGQPA